MTLDRLPIGCKATIQGLRSADPQMTRLMELGVVPGATVAMLGRAPFSGPVRLALGQTRLSIRLEQAAAIDVEPEP